MITVLCPIFERISKKLIQYQAQKMAAKKRHWLWNILIVLTVIVCIGAFAAHYKNLYYPQAGHVILTPSQYH